MSLDDRLSFGEGPLGGPSPEPEPEPEPEEGGRPNRAFIFIAIAMAGLILLGILALVGALTFIVPRQKDQRIASITQTIDAATAEAAAWTPTFTATPTTELPTWTPTAPATWTPIPTATATRVVSDQGDQGQLAATPTPTRASSADWGTTTPAAGLGGLGTAAIAVGLAGLVFAVRKLRLRD
jgi:hypothetical protein